MTVPACEERLWQIEWMRPLQSPRAITAVTANVMELEKHDKTQMMSWLPTIASFILSCLDSVLPLVLDGNWEE